MNPPKPSPGAIAADAPVSFVPMPAVDAAAGAITGAQERPFAAVRKGYTGFADGDVLLAKITPCFENGKAAVAAGLRNGVGFGSSEFHVLRSRGAVLPEYLHHFVRQPAFREVGAENMTGTAGQARVPVEYVREVELPVPPLAEQRRIVNAADTLLAQVGAARDRLAAVQRIVARFRQAVLAAACSGRLTASWREEQVEAFDNASSASDTERPAACDWSDTTIGAVTECLDHLRRPVNAEARSRRRGTVPYYGANGQTGWIAEHLFDETLVLVVEDETFVGRTRPFSYLISGKTWVNNHAHVLRPTHGISAEYLNACLSYYDFIPLTSGTTGRRKLTKAALLAAPIQIPPRHEQDVIMDAVNGAFSLADAVERRAGAALAHVDKLPQAILTKAFTGQLVPTEAELARAEGRDYEPAEALLRHFTARAATGNRRRPRASAAAARQSSA